MVKSKSSLLKLHGPKIKNTRETQSPRVKGQGSPTARRSSVARLHYLVVFTYVKAQQLRGRPSAPQPNKNNLPRNPKDSCGGRWSPIERALRGAIFGWKITSENISPFLHSLKTGTPKTVINGVVFQSDDSPFWGLSNGGLGLIVALSFLGNFLSTFLMSFQSSCKHNLKIK